MVNFSQLAESDARGEKVQRKKRHHAALIAAIVCRIWQDRTRIGPSVRQQPRSFSNITETETCHYFRFRRQERKILRLIRSSVVLPRVREQGFSTRCKLW